MTITQRSMNELRKYIQMITRFNQLINRYFYYLSNILMDYQNAVAQNLWIRFKLQLTVKGDKGRIDNYGNNDRQIWWDIARNA